jgi:hypothetical protein
MSVNSKKSNLWLLRFSLVGMVCFALISGAVSAQAESPLIQMNAINAIISGGTMLSGSGLNFAPAGTETHESPGNLVQDSCFKFFGRHEGPWGKGQYGEKGIWWNSNNAKSTFGRYGLYADNPLFINKGITSALCIINHSPPGPHVYGTTVQQINAFPGKYTITLWASGQDLSNGAVYIVVDRPWKVRPISLPGGTYGWRKFSGSFTTTGQIQLRIITAGTGSACITAITITGNKNL